jgi:hypothetical protein
MLDVFGAMPGLRANLQKSVVYPIKWQNLNVYDLLSVFSGKVGLLPYMDLRLPLGIIKPSKADLQILID